MKLNTIICGKAEDVLKTFPDGCVNMCVTSPPYWALRNYGVDGQLGLEPTFQEYITRLCDIFDEVKRVLKKEGTCWVNMGDTYSNSGGAGSQYKANKFERDKGISSDSRHYGGHTCDDLQEKCLCQIPSRFAIEMCNRGWILRNEIIWHKPNCMPSSAKDRFTVDFEKIFFFTKSKKYYFETQYENNKLSVKWKEPNKKYLHKTSGDSETSQIKKFNRVGSINNNRNKRCVWKINTKPYKEAHFATYPPALIETPIKAGCPKGGIVLDPFFGSGTSGLVAKNLNRNYIGIELNKEYIKIAERRLAQGVLDI